MNTYVAFTADASGRYCHVYGTAQSHKRGLLTMLSNDFVNSIVSSGTLREQDLIQACMSFLDDEFPKDVDPIYIHRYNTLKDDTYISDACSGRWSEPCADIHDPAYERLTEALIEVFELMDAIAPLGCYFGSSEGDGACIGFWEIETDEE